MSDASSPLQEFKNQATSPEKKGSDVESKSTPSSSRRFSEPRFTISNELWLLQKAKGFYHLGMTAEKDETPSFADYNTLAFNCRGGQIKSELSDKLKEICVAIDSVGEESKNSLEDIQKAKEFMISSTKEINDC